MVWGEKFLPNGFCRISGTETTIQDYIAKTRQICLDIGLAAEAVTAKIHAKKEGYPNNV
jgi:hypothetical protein